MKTNIQDWPQANCPTKVSWKQAWVLSAAQGQQAWPDPAVTVESVCGITAQPMESWSGVSQVTMALAGHAGCSSCAASLCPAFAGGRLNTPALLNSHPSAYLRLSSSACVLSRSSKAFFQRASAS